jgi:hypothetical protein
MVAIKRAIAYERQKAKERQKEHCNTTPRKEQRRKRLTIISSTND